MVTFVILAVVAVVVAIIVGSTTGKDRYAEMSEAEYEAEAKRSSPIGAAMLSLQKNLEPRKVEYLMQRDKRVEGEHSVSGDPPSTGADGTPESKP